MQANVDLTQLPAGCEIDDRYRSVGSDVGARVDSDPGCNSGRPCLVSGLRQVPCPVADVAFVASEHYVVRSIADGNLSRNVARREIDLGQRVLEVQYCPQRVAICGQRKPDWNRALSGRRLEGRELDRFGGCKLALRRNVEHAD